MSFQVQALKNPSIFRAKLWWGTDALFCSLARANGDGGFGSTCATRLCSDESACPQIAAATRISWASDSRQLRAFMDGLRVLSHGITSIIAFDATIGPLESPLAPLLALARFEFEKPFLNSYL
jgi:hypothetical protein